METAELAYNQIFSLVKQLPLQDQMRLKQDLPASPEQDKRRPFSGILDSDKPKLSDEEYERFFFNFPVIDEADIQTMLETHETLDRFYTSQC